MRGFRKIISIFFAAGILSCTFRVSGDVTLAPGLLLRTDYSGHETSYLKSIIRQLDRYAREAGIKAASKEITIICGDGKYFGYFAKNRLYLPGTAPRWQYDFAFRSKLYAALAAHRFNFTLPDNSNGVAPWITKALDAELDAAASSGQYLFANRSFLFILAIILIGQVLATQFGGDIFRTVPLSLSEWLIIAAVTSPVLIIGEIVRLIGRIRA